MLQHQITDQDALDAALAADRFLLFKHSDRCSISVHAFRDYRLFVEAHPDVPTGWIDVVAHRDWAREVARHVEVRHESPQALWLSQGHALWHASHFQITQPELAANVLGANA